MRGTALLILVAFLCFAIQPVSAFAEPSLIGEAVGSGTAEVLVFDDNWSEVGRSYPVFAESRYRTSEGALSFLLKDGTRLDVGNNSEVIVGGEESEYSVLLLEGKVAFNVPEESTLRVRSSGTTVGAGTVIASEGSIVPGEVAGAVQYDGGNTTASAIKGPLSIATPDSMTTTLAEGENIMISSTDEDNTGAAVEEIAGGAVKEGAKTALKIIGAGGVVGAGIAALAEGGDGGGVASPSAP